MEALVDIVVTTNFDHFDLGKPVVFDAVQRPQPGIIDLCSVAYKKYLSSWFRERCVDGCHPEGEHVGCCFNVKDLGFYGFCKTGRNAWLDMADDELGGMVGKGIAKVVLKVVQMGIVRVFLCNESNTSSLQSLELVLFE
jgi:hypothetical protein